jgi:glycosyltransferase involved in cell wall biosynthesis
MVLVDDGSSQACADVLQRLSATPDVTLVRHERNRGKGAAVITGLRTAHERGYTHAVQIDADGQHTVSDVSRFVEEARQHPDVVICGRPVFDASMPRSRYYGRYLTHALVWLETLSFELLDTMCGFRVYPLAVLLALLDRSGVGERMDFDTEVLVRLHWRGVRTRWLATEVRYPLDGVSHYRMFRDNVRMTSLHISLLLGMLVRLPLLLWRKAHA